MNPELKPIMTVLIKSYDGLPYHLKCCFLYLSIFPKDYIVRWRRLVRRWTAEGYSKGLRDMSADDIADSYFIALIRRSMILPYKQSVHSRKEIDSCQVHDLMREIGISMATEENLVFRLENGHKLNSRATVRHLAIRSSSVRDKDEFESTVDVSRVRSLTVFGQWKPFFLSDKMKLLRVLDLEDTSGLVDHHLRHIGEHVHLQYLSLRGCDSVWHLPDSLGNLRQLETLDIRHTSIVVLSRSINKLRKLQYLHAGTKQDYYSPPESASSVCRCVLKEGPQLCAACCVPQVLDIDGVNRRDVCTIACCFVFPSLMKGMAVGSGGGVMVPRGIRVLQALHTLRDVQLVGTDAAVEIGYLTGLRKLGVGGINKKNGPGFCSAIFSLSRLESLSVQSSGELGLSGCLDSLSSPPDRLQSLKLFGNLVTLPEWVQNLKNLVKLRLWCTKLSGHDSAMQVLGNLPNLTILRLQESAFQGEQFHFQSESFNSLSVLELHILLGIKSVKFDQGTMPKLEQLQVQGVCDEIPFDGLESLPSLKEVQLDIHFNIADESKFMSCDEENRKEILMELERQENKFREHFRIQLSRNPNKPILKAG